MRGEVLDEIAADLVAAWSNTRTDCCHDIARPGAEARRERANSHHGGAGCSAFPAGMHRCHGAAAAIGQEDRHTVGRADGERQRRMVAHGNVRLGDKRGLDPFLGHKHVRAMHLPHAHEPLKSTPSARPSTSQPSGSSCLRAFVPSRLRGFAPSWSNLSSHVLK